MKTNKMLFFYILLLSLILIFPLNTYPQAAPMPPRLVINHQQRQCAQIVPGDECGDVILPLGWEYLDPNYEEQCPEEYTFVDLAPDWIHFKASFCCTEGHSGSPGDCEDMVIHQSNHHCAFVEDINHCTSLPEGWESSAENCPPEFAWIADVVCIEREAGTPTTAAIIPQTQPGSAVLEQNTPPPTETRQPTPADKDNPILPCGSTGLMLIALFILRFL